MGEDDEEDVTTALTIEVPKVNTALDWTGLDCNLLLYCFTGLHYAPHDGTNKMIFMFVHCTQGVDLMVGPSSQDQERDSQGTKQNFCDFI